MRNFSVSFQKSRRGLAKSGTRRNVASRRNVARRGGQAMIETGVVIFVLILLSMGLLQYGILFNAKLALNNLAREGARYAAVHTRNPVDANSDPAGFKALVVQRLKDKAAGTSIDPAALNAGTVAISSLSGKTDASGQPILDVGDSVRVQITYNLRDNKIFVPIVFPGMTPAFRDNLVNYKIGALQNIEG